MESEDDVEVEIEIEARGDRVGSGFRAGSDRDEVLSLASAFAFCDFPASSGIS